MTTSGYALVAYAINANPGTPASDPLLLHLNTPSFQVGGWYGVCQSNECTWSTSPQAP
jgi:hypothetical protein